MTYEFYITPEEYRIAEMNGVSNNLLESRVRGGGWAKEKAISKPPRQRSKEKRRYAEIAEQNGIKRVNFEMRINRGWSVEDAATIPLRTRDSQSQRLLSNEEIKRAESLGVKRTTIYMRLSRGWSKERALNTPTVSNSESLIRATAASPFREMDEIYWNMRRGANLNDSRFRKTNGESV